MVRTGVLSSLLALAPLALPAQASAQAVPSPNNNFGAAVNGMVSLCPALVGGGTVPDAAAAAPFGLRPISAPAGEHRFQSLFNDGMVQVWFEPAQHRCTTHYAGPGFRAIAGVARDLATESRFTRILLDEARSGIRGDVFERATADPARRERYTIGENATSQTAAVSFSERTMN